MYVGRVEKLLAHYSQIPLCFVNLNGKITRASSKIAEVFKYDGIIGRDIFELTRIKPAELIEAAQNETNLYLDSNDKSFKILSEFIGEGETASIMMSFIDVTSYEVLKDMYNDEKACIAVINVDNFDDSQRRRRAGTGDLHRDRSPDPRLGRKTWRSSSAVS